MEAVLEAREVEFKALIKYPDISIFPLQTTFICGKSGCGKSTLLKMFNGTVSPSSGTILYNGDDITSLDIVEHRRKVMLASQNVFLYDDSIAGNFAQFYRSRELPAPPEDKIRKILEICCADFDISLDCKRLSGGERQRIFAAICLSFEPEVLMMDEPTSALDSETSEKFIKNIKEYCRGNSITLVIVSHAKDIADNNADRVIYLGEKE